MRVNCRSRLILSATAEDKASMWWEYVCANEGTNCRNINYVNALFDDLSYHSKRQALLGCA